MQTIMTEEDWQRIVPHLLSLVDVDPTQAIAEARQLRGTGSVKLAVQTLRAGILIDAGGKAGDGRAVKEGIKNFLRLKSKVRQLHI
jgi:hypothetical protein